jgi:tetratricopeptide (TPR) repeat protein
VLSVLPLLQDPAYYMHYSQQNNDATTYQCGNWPISTDYDFYRGTSLSAAHVSGLVGMLYAMYYSSLTGQSPTWEAEDLKNIIIKSAQDFNDNDYSIYNNWGSGIINAYEALLPPHPNLSLRQYQIGTTSLYNYPLPNETLVNLLPSMEWGSSQSIKLQIKNKWAVGTNVRVQMSTTDPNITFTYPGDNDRYTIGNIAAETTVWTENMWIRDWSHQVRTNVPITISISANDMPNRVYTLSINVLQNTAAIVGSIAMLQGETITTDLVVSNLDGIGDDELLVGTSAGRLFCYKNNGWIHVGTLPQGFSVNPAMGDINGDGQKEIVAIDSAGNVRVYNNSLVQLRSYQSQNNEKVTWSIAIEDVTGDNILDILYTTDRTNQSLVNAGLRVIDYYNNTPYSYTTDRVIASPIAIGNVDNDPDYEIVIAYKDKYNVYGQLIDLKGCFGVYKFNNGLFDTVVSEWLLGLDIVERIQGPIIADCNGDYLPEIMWLLNSTNTLMMYSYYSLLDTSWPQISSTGLPLNFEIANIVEHQPGLSYVTLKDANQTRLLQVGYGNPQPQNYSFIPIDDSAFKVISADILDPPPPNPSGGTYQQELIVVSDHSISYFQPHYNNQHPIMLNELILYKTTVSSQLKSAAIANYNNGIVLYAISSDGYLYSYSYQNRRSKTNEIGQIEQSSRHTRTYEQPIPQEIRNNITISHPFVVDKPVTAYSTILTINEGVVGRFESGKSISAKRIDVTPDVNIYGSEDNPVILRGFGSGSSNNFWNGLVLNNDSNLNVNWVEVYGAHQALDISGTGSRFVKYSKFINNYQNINCYNSIVNFYYNYITDAIHGVSAYHFAGPMLNNTLTSRNGLNEIAGNEYGVFSDSSTPVLKDGHNNLANDRYNLYLQNLPLMSGPIHAENNWWGHTDLREVTATINPANRVAFLPYDMQPNLTLIREDQSSNMFEDGFAYMLNGEYRNAINCFNGVLADSLICESDVVSLYALFECYNQLGEITLLETQLDHYIDDADYTLIYKPMKNVRALIYRETERFSLAIDHYESILLDNPAFQDSCYAVIDLGDTYLESNGRSSGQLTQYIPVSYALHQQNREALLSSVFQLSETENSADTTPPIQLLGNYPNPFNPSTTIQFKMKADSNIMIDIYNIRGQKVSTILNE